jgi:hypothetical protein
VQLCALAIETVDLSAERAVLEAQRAADGLVGVAEIDELAGLLELDRRTEAGMVLREHVAAGNRRCRLLILSEPDADRHPGGDDDYHQRIEGDDAALGGARFL